MKDILTSNGWHYTGNCTGCSGGFELWKKNDNLFSEYTFKISVRQGYYLLLRNNTQIHKGNVNDIQAKISEISQQV